MRGKIVLSSRTVHGEENLKYSPNRLQAALLVHALPCRGYSPLIKCAGSHKNIAAQNLFMEIDGRILHGFSRGKRSHEKASRNGMKIVAEENRRCATG
jgi:hypothetical protein